MIITAISFIRMLFYGNKKEQAHCLIIYNYSSFVLGRFQTAVAPVGGNRCSSTAGGQTRVCAVERGGGQTGCSVTLLSSSSGVSVVDVDASRTHRYTLRHPRYSCCCKGTDSWVAAITTSVVWWLGLYWNVSRMTCRKRRPKMQ